jgi:hypothetical protein
VEFVEYCGLEITQERIGLKPGCQDSLRGYEQARGWPEAAIQTDLPANLFSDMPALFLGDSAGNRSGSNASGLEQNRPTRFEESRRNPGSFSGSGRCHNDQSASRLERLGDLVQVIINW